MRQYLQKAGAAPASAGQLRRIAEAFARRYGASPKTDPAADLPGWIRTRLDELEAGYATEWAELSAIEGVRVILPRP